MLAVAAARAAAPLAGLRRSPPAADAARVTPAVAAGAGRLVRAGAPGRNSTASSTRPQFDRMQWGVLVQSLDIGRGALRAERDEADDAGVEHEDRHAGRGGGAPRVGLSPTRHRSLTAGADRGRRADGRPRGGRAAATRRSTAAAAAPRACSRRGRTGCAPPASARSTAASSPTRGAFDRETLGAGWAWDYLAYGYAARRQRAAVQRGRRRRWSSGPGRAGRAGGRRGPADRERPGPRQPGHDGRRAASRTSSCARLPGSNRLVVHGHASRSAPRKSSGSVTVDDPALYFARVLRATLVAQGHRGDGRRRSSAWTLRPVAAGRRRPRAARRTDSPPLSEIARVLMKVSQNLYAETLLRTLGRARRASGSAQRRPEGGARGARRAGASRPTRTSCPTARGCRATTTSARRRS